MTKYQPQLSGMCMVTSTVSSIYQRSFPVSVLPPSLVVCRKFHRLSGV